MQPTGAIGCGLPIAAAGRPFYFVEVSEAPVQAPSPRRSLEAGLHHGGAGCHLPQVLRFIMPLPSCRVERFSICPQCIPTAPVLTWNDGFASAAPNGWLCGGLPCTSL